MNINFTQIFQDSWNFMRNQPPLVISFCLFFFLLNFTTQTLFGAILSNISEQSQAAQMATQLPNDIAQMARLMTMPNILFISFTSEIINALLATWALIAIHQINQHNQFSLIQTLGISLRYFIGMLIIRVLIIFPLLYGLTNLLLGGVLGLVLTLIGGYLFLRLCLAPLIYIFENKSFFLSIQYCWQRTKKGLAVLAIYCLINYLLFFIISNQLNSLAQNIVLQIIAIALISAINVFLLIFNYRFYSLFIHQS